LGGEHADLLEFPSIQTIRNLPPHRHRAQQVLEKHREQRSSSGG
jgi:hypothetical protein